MAECQSEDEQKESPPQAERRKSSLSELGSKLTSLILPLKTLVQRPPPRPPSFTTTVAAANNTTISLSAAPLPAQPPRKSSSPGAFVGSSRCLWSTVLEVRSEAKGPVMGKNENTDLHSNGYLALCLQDSFKKFLCALQFIQDIYIFFSCFFFKQKEPTPGWTSSSVERIPPL